MVLYYIVRLGFEFLGLLIKTFKASLQPNELLRPYSDFVLVIKHNILILLRLIYMRKMS